MKCKMVLQRKNISSFFDILKCKLHSRASYTNQGEITNSICQAFQTEVQTFIPKVSIGLGIPLKIQCSTYVTKKRIEETMLKMLPKHVAKLNKTKLAMEPSSHIKLTSSLHPKKTKTLNRDILRREYIVSTVLLRELQNLIDSGAIDEELAEMGVIFKSVMMHGKLSSTVTWESQGMPLDQRIYDTLTRHAATIRHVIMQSHVVGVIPKFKFAIDTFAEEQHQVREILASKDFDIGQPEPCDEVPIFAKDPKVEEKISNKKQKSSDPNFQIFQVDVANLQQKIKESKFNANNDLVNETESER